MVRAAQCWVGTSGYAYPAWRGRFYPAELSIKRELGFAASKFSSIEINRSFYALLTPAACQAWRAAVPPGFVFALKGSRFITHNKKLRDVDQALANFFAAGPLALGDMLGPIVWQLNEKMPFDAERLEAFLSRLPRTTGEAAALAARHDDRLKHGAAIDVEHEVPMRHVLEPRHESFFTRACVAMLRRHRVALAISDSPRWSYLEEPTTDFMYIRLHGSQKLYASQYSDAELDHWAARVRAYQRGEVPRDARRVSERQRVGKQDVYVYFDNDAEAYAAHDAQRLLQRLSPDARAKLADSSVDAPTRRQGDLVERAAPARRGRHAS